MNRVFESLLESSIEWCFPSISKSLVSISIVSLYVKPFVILLLKSRVDRLHRTIIGHTPHRRQWPQTTCGKRYRFGADLGHPLPCRTHEAPLHPMWQTVLEMSRCTTNLSFHKSLAIRVGSGWPQSYGAVLPPTPRLFNTRISSSLPLAVSHSIGSDTDLNRLQSDANSLLLSSDRCFRS